MEQLYNEVYEISFRCYYPNDPQTTTHRQLLKLTNDTKPPECSGGLLY